MKRLLVLGLIAPLLGVGGVWYWRSNSKSAQTFRREAIKRGDLEASINATGTIEPEKVIDVGAQVAGLIKSFGHDPRDAKKPIDYRTPVEEGTILAHIDDSLYKAQVDQAKANLAHAVADVGQLKARENQAERDWVRAQRLKSDNTITAAELEVAETTYVAAKAATAVGEAAIDQAKAALNQAEINLSYCTIKSPVKGVIVDRRVNIGQTVVASLSSPSLFLIAQDLKRLEVWASVNEADIGNIHSGQEVTFSVDAFPGRVFRGKVAPDQPRLNASSSQNVVTYPVVVVTDNTDGKLLPYMTANLRFLIGKQTNVLSVPNAALRFRPSPENVAAEFREKRSGKTRRGGGDGEQPATERESASRGTVWVAADDGFLRPIRVTTGLSDGARTEVEGEGIDETTEVVIGIAQSAAPDDTKNPFTTQTFRRQQSQEKQEKQ